MVDPADVKLLKGCSSRGRGQEAETELPGAVWAWDVDRGLLEPPLTNWSRLNFDLLFRGLLENKLEPTSSTGKAPVIRASDIEDWTALGEKVSEG
ncbi:MAG: hypothetical protein ACRC4N_17970 [Gammaproteobacteria bacterium]